MWFRKALDFAVGGWQTHSVNANNEIKETERSSREASREREQNARLHLPCALSNSDNRCYMNAALQCMVHCPPFHQRLDCLVNHWEEVEHTLPDLHRLAVKDCLSMRKANILGRRVHELHRLPPVLHTGHHEDAQEFISQCWHGWESDASFLSEIWMGAEAELYTCQETACGHQQGALMYDPMEVASGTGSVVKPFSMLHLDVTAEGRPMKHLDECINEYFKEELVQIEEQNSQVCPLRQ